jgi:predicted nucleic acid-binding protein
MFVDTSALYARIDEDDAHHEAAQAVFEGLHRGDLPYRPLYVTSHVLAELVTLAMLRLDAGIAATTLGRLQASELVTVVHPGAETFGAASVGFITSQEYALVDHLTAVAATNRNVEHVFSFDTDFRELDLTLVPADTGSV